MLLFVVHLGMSVTPNAGMFLCPVRMIAGTVPFPPRLCTGSPAPLSFPISTVQTSVKIRGSPLSSPPVLATTPASWSIGVVFLLAAASCTALLAALIVIALWHWKSLSKPARRPRVRSVSPRRIPRNRQPPAGVVIPIASSAPKPTPVALSNIVIAEDTSSPDSTATQKGVLLRKKTKHLKSQSGSPLLSTDKGCLQRKMPSPKAKQLPAAVLAASGPGLLQRAQGSHRRATSAAKVATLPAISEHEEHQAHDDVRSVLKQRPPKPSPLRREVKG